MKIYIAGRVTDNPTANKEFSDAEQWVRKQHPEAIILNPTILPEGMEYGDYMDICLAMVRACDVLYTIRGWNTSPGAQAEVALAFALNKEVRPIPKTDTAHPEIGYPERDYITVDAAGKSVFTCPQCGWHQLEQIITDATMTLPMILLDVNADSEYDMDRVYNDGGVIDRFQCSKCGFIIKNKDGKPVDSEINLLEVLSDDSSKV